ncbi:hypothetical protein C8Q78DRAFT_379057 [Trametes maxima]|nr:hypothetical protein C8Q78DRAFT_379057 [Trametes maxima]
MSMFPWDNLHSDTVRIVIKDLGLSEYTVRARRAELIKLLRDVETDGVEAVVQRLQERAARMQSPEIEYAGPSSSPGPQAQAQARAGPVRAHVPGVHPVVEIPSRPGPSRLPPRRRVDSSETGASASVSVSVSTTGAPHSAKKPRIRPPSYAVIHQLEEEIGEPSAAPVPLLYPHRMFEGVFLPPPRRMRQGVATVDGDGGDSDEGMPQSISVSHAPVASGGMRPAGGPSFARRFEAVEVPLPVEAVMSQWKQSSSSSRRRNED